MKNKTKINDVSVKRQWVELITPIGFFCGIDRMKWPSKSWKNEFDLAQKISETSKSVVGFKRFVLDSKRNRVYLDDGYVLFRGKFLYGEDALRLDEVKDSIGPVAVARLRQYGGRIVYFQNKTAYPMKAEDKFIAF
jgi:hypothetical protein